MKKSEKGVGWSHGDVENEVYVVSIVHIRRFNLKQIGGVTEHQLVVVSLGLASSSVENVPKLFTVQKIDREPTKVSSLEHMGEFLKMKV